MLKDKRTRLFFILGGFFLANTLIAEFVGVKIFSLESTLGFTPFDWTICGVDGLGFSLTAGVVLWPIVFVMTDIINEYFGKKGVRSLTNFTVLVVLYAFAMVYFTISLEPNSWWDTQSGLIEEPMVEQMDNAFKAIFGQGLWIIVGSLVAFLVGQIVDVMVFQKIRSWTGEKSIWLRATGSTLVSQFIDSYIVLIIAFYIGADWDIVRVIAIGTVNYIYKFAMAILLTPVIYLAHHLIDSYLGKTLADTLKHEATL